MAQRASVIVYHAVGDCPPDQDPYGLFVGTDAFEEQIDFLVRRRDVVTLEAALFGERNGRAPVAITFDDGYRNNLTIAAPILQKYGVPATVFVPTGWLGRRSEWIETQSPTCDSGIMTADELVQIEGFGITVESHGHAHVDMGTTDPRAVAQDLHRSRTLLAEVLGHPTRFLAYPWGNCSAAAREVARDAGFDAALSIDRPDEGPFFRSRMTVNPVTGPFAFSLKTSGYFESIRYSPFVSGSVARLARVRRRRAGIQV